MDDAMREALADIDYSANCFLEYGDEHGAEHWRLGLLDVTNRVSAMLAAAPQPSQAGLPDREAIDRLTDLLARATQRPWRIVRYGDGDSLVIHDARGDWRVCFMSTPGENGDVTGIEANAELIVEAVNALPAILASLRSQGGQETGSGRVPDGTEPAGSAPNPQAVSALPGASLSREGSVNDISDAELLGRFVRGLRGQRGRRRVPLFSKVSERSGLGSTYSAQLCRRFGLDPFEEVNP